jgi:Flp pilus assembly pilin Flp
MRKDQGQAAVEYIAIVLLVALVLSAAVALTSGGLGTAVEASIRRGICAVTSDRCPRLVAASIPSDLEACPLARKMGNQQLSLDVGIVRLAAQLGLTVEHMSDGKVRVSFADGGKSGLPIPKLSTSMPDARISAICLSLVEK